MPHGSALEMLSHSSRFRSARVVTKFGISPWRSSSSIGVASVGSDPMELSENLVVDGSPCVTWLSKLNHGRGFLRRRSRLLLSVCHPQSPDLRVPWSLRRSRVARPQFDGPAGGLCLGEWNSV